MTDFAEVCRQMEDSQDRRTLWQKLLKEECVQAQLGNILREAEATKSALMSTTLGSPEEIAEAQQIQVRYRTLLRAFDILTEEYDDGRYNRPV